MKSLHLTSALITTSCAFQPHHGYPKKNRYGNGRSCKVALQMKPPSTGENEIGKRIPERRRTSDTTQPENLRTSLFSATLDSIDFFPNETGEPFPPLSKIPKALNFGAATKVISASLLITGNTVGPGMFVLPEAVGGVGMVWGSALFFGLYVYNLISGLLLAEVAIYLHESSDCEVPSSFKDFADTALKSKTASNLITAASLIINSCVLAFGVVHAGSLAVSLFPNMGVEPTAASVGFAAILTAFSLTQTNEGLERVANAAVMVLFSSFASILLPSLAQVHDPMGTILASGSHPGGLAAAFSAAAPLLFSCLIYQNIVPSITKLLNFDRTKSTIAIALGSFIPMAMYVAWCFAVLGRGLDESVADGGGGIFSAFSASALAGSSIACVMSLAEEYESIISNATPSDESCSLNERYSVPAVALSVAPSVIFGLAFSGGGDFTEALHFAGAFISPYLYGLLPVMLAQQMQTKGGTNATSNLSQMLLGAGTLVFFGQEIIQDLSSGQGWAV